MSQNDTEKFYEMQSSADDSRRPTNNSRMLKAEAPDSDDDKKNPGAPTQYSQFADGYIPTRSTIETLPAGCYRIAWANNVPYFQPHAIKTDDILSLPDSKSEMVIAEIERFWSDEIKKRFREESMLYKRGFMLFGPPGSGKTCTVSVVIKNMIDRGGLVILGDHPGALARMMGELRHIEPQRPLVVILEDIDAIIERSGESDMLALLDGESQVDNVVFLATTNYPQRLDKRFVNRPSRFDRIIHIGMPNIESRRLYLSRSFKNGLHIDGVDLDAATEGLSIAHLRELIVSIKIFEMPVGETIERLKAMKITPKSSEERRIGIEAPDNHWD